MRSIGLALATLALALAVGACDRVPERLFQRTLEPPGDQPATTFGDYEPEVLAGALHGEWIVERGDRRLFEFSIHGESAKVVDHRYTTSRTVEGELVLRSATGFGVQPPDGVTYFYSFVDSGERVYMGMGAAIATRRDGAFKAKLGAWETLTFDGDSCLYERAFGGDVHSEEVACGFQDKKKPKSHGPAKSKDKDKDKDKSKDDGEADDEAAAAEPVERVFSYTAADPFRPGKKKTVELIVAGDYLISRELADSTARSVPWEDKVAEEAKSGAAAAAAPSDAGAVPEPDAGPTLGPAAAEIME